MVGVERLEQEPHDLLRLERILGCAKQVDGQPGGWIRVRDLVGEFFSEFGLAHASPSAQAGDERPSLKRGFEFFQFVRPPGKVLHWFGNCEQHGNNAFFDIQLPYQFKQFLDDYQYLFCAFACPQDFQPCDQVTEPFDLQQLHFQAIQINCRSFAKFLRREIPFPIVGNISLQMSGKDVFI